MARGDHNFKDETGNIYGRLTVLRYAGQHHLGLAQWECRCECGAITIARGSKLRTGDKRSCGCLRRDNAKKMRGLSDEERHRRLTQPRQCSRCKGVFPPEEFNFEVNRHYCRKCKKEMCKQAIIKGGGYRVSCLRQKYGLTLEEFNQMAESQGGVCLICGNPPKEGKPLCVDHDHARGTGRESVRALLCDECNTGIGLFRDNPERLRAAADYLEKFPRNTENLTNAQT